MYRWIFKFFFQVYCIDRVIALDNSNVFWIDRSLLLGKRAIMLFVDRVVDILRSQ